MGKLKYGNIGLMGEPLFTTVGEFAASDVLSAKSGRYVVYDDSENYWRAANDGEDQVTGYVEQHLTCSSTAGATRLSIAMNLSDFATEMPYATSGAAATLTSTTLKDWMGKLGDIYVASNIQYVNAGAGTDNLFRIVGGDVAENTLYVTVMDTESRFVS